MYHYPIEECWNVMNMFTKFRFFGAHIATSFQTVSHLIQSYQSDKTLPMPPYCYIGEEPYNPKDFFQLQEWYLPHLTELMTIQ